jgi:hypothetical protein
VHFKLIWSGPDQAIKRPENVGLDSALRRLTAASAQNVTLVDASHMSDEERFAIYIREAVPATRSRYKVARVFGSDSHNGEDFGLRVPALIAYNSDTDLTGVDVFPHEKEDGRIVTMLDGLSMFGLR